VEIAMGHQRRHRQTKTPNCQLELFEPDPPAGGALTPDWSALPERTQRELTDLMTRLLVDHAGGEARDPGEAVDDL
jgi:hypothetical protein